MFTANVWHIPAWDSLYRGHLR